ncbi:hypothetical protein DPMN_011712 [Dreissena polymorpha]|uniref:MAM domain-containing protein n=1 Tax=Dreissena polymorpha TaxID=45954 RepID=A0A9D4N5M7_DREPO|nr:hypothetical protein DPMN_011712 [Dreissena polymorpha]
MCTWSNLRNDNFDWLIGSGATTSSFTGPSSDHTRANSGDNSGTHSFLWIQIFCGNHLYSNEN